MRITDAMVERACKIHNVGWSVWHEPQKKTAREVMRAALAAAMPDPVTTIPRLDNCGRYLAEGKDGQWYYINHAGEWQPYQGPENLPDRVTAPQTHRTDEAGFVDVINDDVPFVVRDLAGPAAALLDPETRKVVGYRVYTPDPVTDEPVAWAEYFLGEYVGPKAMRGNIVDERYSYERLYHAATVARLQAEIERLREHMGASRVGLVDQLLAAEAERDRLREALAEIERLYWQEDSDLSWRATYMNGVARAALSTEGDGR